MTQSSFLRTSTLVKRREWWNNQETNWITFYWTYAEMLMNLPDKEKHPYLVLGLRNHCSRSRGEKHNNGERQKLLKAPLLRGEALRRKRTRRSDKRRLNLQICRREQFLRISRGHPLLFPALGDYFLLCVWEKSFSYDWSTWLPKERGKNLSSFYLSHGRFREMITTSRKLSREMLSTRILLF